MVKVGAIGVGGRGIRLRREDIQKCLIPIEGKPILEYTLEAFLQIGIRTIFLLTGFLYEQVDAYVAGRDQKYGCAIRTIFGGTKGQIPSVLTLRELINEDFLYAGGDCILPTDTIRKLIRSAARHPGSVAVMSATRTEEFVQSHPRIEVIGRSRLVKKIHQPDAPGAPQLIGRGMYYFRPEIFNFLAGVKSSSTSPIAEFVEHARLMGSTVATSITNDPIFCLHVPDDLAAWKNSKVRELLRNACFPGD